jgi:4-diphosphocytidyl-2-C-methyl-D-erythritol kinase
LTPAREIAAAKINLALHVRGRRADGRHDIETVFAFCIDGDRLEGQFHPGAGAGFALEIDGPFAGDLEGTNLIEKAWDALRSRVGEVSNGYTRLVLKKNLPVASGLGGGSADAAAALRLLTSLWGIDPAHAVDAAPGLGSDVPACLLSMSARGSGAGDVLELIDDGRIAGAPVLLVNPMVPLSTGEVFARWDGVDRGPLGDWRDGRNDLEAAATSLVPQIGEVLDGLRGREGASIVRMSGSGASCFALFDSDEARDAAAGAVPDQWWRLATKLR